MWTEILRLHARVRRSLIINVLSRLGSQIPQSCVLFCLAESQLRQLQEGLLLEAVNRAAGPSFFRGTSSPHIVLRTGSGVSEESSVTPAGCRSACMCCSRQIRTFAPCNFFLPLMINVCGARRRHLWFSLCCQSKGFGLCARVWPWY